MRTISDFTNRVSIVALILVALVMEAVRWVARAVYGIIDYHPRPEPVKTEREELAELVRQVEAARNRLDECIHPAYVDVSILELSAAEARLSAFLRECRRQYGCRPAMPVVFDGARLAG